MRVVAALWLFLLPACPTLADEARYPVLGDATAEGRDVWLNNCEGCHAYGFAGSPNPFKPDHWRARLKKDKSVLYRHALEGFFGPKDTFMPPRGGTDSLSDREVKSAVDYMRALAQHTINKEEKK